jgi:hypothetical protein
MKKGYMLTEFRFNLKQQRSKTMKSARLFSLGVFILIFAFSTLLYADVPQMINYQGKLTTPAGALIDSTLSMVFSIYDNEPDVSPAWAETLVVQVQKGIFSVVLGNVHPIPPALFDGTVQYLGVKAGTDPEMTPRKPMVSVPYAMNAGGGSVNCADCDDRFVNTQGPDSVYGTSSQPMLTVDNDGSGSGILVRDNGIESLNAGGYGIYASGFYGNYLKANNSSYYAAVCQASGGSSSYPGLKVYGYADITGNLSKGGGSFKIDHPLDPENKYLYHSFVESPDMMNVYNGNVILNANGEAVVELPEYFSALNRDFRYQLTCIGGFAPVYVANKISGNQFTIAGGESGMEVSWQVTGIRKDPYAEANRIQVEVEKASQDKGRYLHPQAYGVSAEYAIDYEQNRKLEDNEVE